MPALPGHTTARAVFPHAAFTKIQDVRDAKEGIKRDLLAPVRLIHSTSLLGRGRTGFSLKELFRPPSSLLIWFPFSSRLSSSAAFPDPCGRRLLGHAALAALPVLCSRPTTDKASLATSLALIGSLTPVPPGDSVSPPEVTRCSSLPCRPQTPWCGG